MTEEEWDELIVLEETTWVAWRAAADAAWGRMAGGVGRAGGGGQRSSGGATEWRHDRSAPQKNGAHRWLT